MEYLNAFLFCGLVCAIGQLILDNTKLTPGHVTSMFVVIGAILAFFSLYEPLVEWAGAGATLPITNFGRLLYESSLEGYRQSGPLGLFTGLLVNGSAGISAAVIFAFILTVFTNPKD